MVRTAAAADEEIRFDPDEIIVSKTDRTGRITYGNSVFVRVSGYDRGELIGQPHSILRHDDMPRCVFKLLWDEIAAGTEVFAYVKNRAKSGAYYWAFAHVTPNFGTDGQIDGYHSSRRVPDRRIVESKIIPLYDRLLTIERRAADRKQGLKDSFGALQHLLKEKGVDYNEFVFSL
ncbi:PAS domain-containing protein [Caenispirillum bisanense]|uniref:PAS domain S-box-containing protein n=1 Tax=Caenispirillum bisanense TaxID=414052 RepID=A0A286G3V4_9PROT|nr:PAS domain-containing protein [Caenispirillum bisanense]SOD90247.1 PAS domain S-box-containing protein [Caenispirillum bisanense]